MVFKCFGEEQLCTLLGLHVPLNSAAIDSPRPVKGLLSFLLIWGPASSESFVYKSIQYGQALHMAVSVVGRWQNAYRSKKHFWNFLL